MKKNLNTADRIIRVLIFVATAVIYYTGVLGPNIGLALLIVGGILFLTAIVNFCPIYKLFGCSTCGCKVKTHEAKS